MTYKCILKLKRPGLFKSIWVGETINQAAYNQLTADEKKHFIEDDSNETIEDIIKKEDEESH